MNPRALLRYSAVCAAVWVAGCATPGAWAQSRLGSMRADGDAAEFGAGKGEDTERPWIKHKVVPRERIEDIEARYGVSKKELVRWNKRLQKKQWIYAGQVLRIKARRTPPPREKISYTVKSRDRWAEIAKAHNAPKPPTITTTAGLPSCENDPEWTRTIRAAFVAELGADQVKKHEPSLGGEDFGIFGSELGIPAIMWKLGAVKASDWKRGGDRPGLHSDGWAPDPDPTLRTGIRTVVAAVRAGLR